MQRPTARRFLLRAASRAALCAAVGFAVGFGVAACGGASPPHDGALPPSVVDDATWEREWLPEDPHAPVEGHLLTPVTDADGTQRFDPVEGAEIELLLTRPDGWGEPVRKAVTTTGKGGAYRFDAAPEGAFILRARAAGYADSIGGRLARIPGAVEFPAGEEPMLGVQPPAELRGRIVTRDGQGVPGVRIEVVGLAHHSEVRSGADGVFTATVPRGVITLTVSDAAWDVPRAWKEPRHYRIDLSGDVAPPGSVIVAPVAPYSGVVTDTLGTPIAGAVVLWLSDPTQRTVTRADGTFDLPVRREGRVAAFAPGFAWRSYDVARAASQEIRLPPGEKLSGVVRDADGAPAAGVRLLALCVNPEGGFDRVPGPLTGPDGAFDFSWIPHEPRWSDRSVSVVAFHRRLGISQVVPVPPSGAAAAQPVALRLSGWRDVPGRLVDDGGRPVAGARVTADWTCDGLDATSAAALLLPTTRVTVTASDGTFLLRETPADRVVRAGADIYGLRLSQDIAAGRAGHADLRLPAGCALSGTVTGREGEPVPGARVTVKLLDTPGLQLERSATTGAGGAFTFDDLPMGRYYLEAEAPGYDHKGSGEGRPGMAPVKIVVERSARVAVRLRFDGLPADAQRPALTVLLEDAEAPSLPPRRIKVAEGTSGDVEVGLVRPGRATLRVEGGDWRGRIDDVEIRSGERQIEEIAVVRTLRLRGTLLDFDGTPLSGEQVLVHASPAASRPPQTLWSADGGVLDGAGFFEGEWTLRVSPRDRAPFTMPLRFPLAAPVEVRLPPSGRLVVRAAGDAARGGIVSITDADGRPLYAWSRDAEQLATRFRLAADGVLDLRGVPAGRVRVELSGGAARASREADVRAGGEAAVSFE